MPILGKGMLLTSMDIDQAHEADFNRWYDREHLEERVAIKGFIEARRYVAEQGGPKYLCLYSTETIDVLDSPAYKARLANPTEWSRKTMANFRNMIRSVSRITISRGAGRGAMLGIVRLRPKGGQQGELRDALRRGLEPTRFDGVVSMHLIETDPALSGPTTEIPAAAGTGDWFILVDATDERAARGVLTHLTRDGGVNAAIVSSGVYRLMWDLSNDEISTS